MKTFYFAYGMNTDQDGMAIRCPHAKPVGIGKLSDHELVMRGVADIVNKPGAELTGAVWQITPKCEEALDMLEGFPSFYGKKKVEVVMASGKKIECMVYQMQPHNQNSQYPASMGYYTTLKRGYTQFGISLDQLERANDFGDSESSDLSSVSDCS